MFKRLAGLNFIIVILLFASVLRLYKISVNPPSLFGDELDLGYQAYSILKTGRDYQGNLMPVHFHSLAEWRTPLYLYSVVPTVAVFGITPIGVRLPAAIFGILSIYTFYLLVKKITTEVQTNTEKQKIGIAEISAFLLAISPWHLQYSRAGFEVTLLLFLMITGIYLFLKSLDEHRYLWLSIVCLVLTPWVYATAKLFTPILLIFLYVVYRKDIRFFDRSNIVKSTTVGLVLGLPIVYSTIFGGGTQRISDISIFTDPQMEQVVGSGRELNKISGAPLVASKLVNNKFVYYGGVFVNNYFKSFSTEFLFLKGDTNLRQSIGIGELYLIEIIPLIFGFGFLILDNKVNFKNKLLIFFWIIFGAIPSAFTLSGGNHATRLILMLPPLILLISYGWACLYKLISSNYKYYFILFISILYFVFFSYYIHQYYFTYPIVSEHWWHYGWAQSISEIKKIDKNYDRVIVSMSGEPAWIFFASNYEYPPTLWQNEFPIGRDVELTGFGKVSHTGKYYFGSPNSEIQIYGLGRVINSKTLYLANAKEIGDNLITHPASIPSELKLIKTVVFPSGEPAFYLFSGTEN